MNIKTEITKLHYNKQPKGIIFNILKFASLFYGVGSGIKNFLYEKRILKPTHVNAYVISVGNLTTGGVGKTPIVAEIAKHLSSKGNKVGIISRGYGGKLSNKQINLISDGEKIYYNATLAGDEPYWLAENTSAIIVTSKDRIRAAKFAIKEFGVNKIILDDGFQHRKLHRDLDIVLMDSEKTFGNKYQLPAGPLRENLDSLHRVDKLVIVSKNIDHSNAENLASTIEQKSGIPTFVCHTEPDIVYNINNGKMLHWDKDIIAMSAIGQPEQFFKFLTNYNIIQKLVFDDHHSYSKSDIPSKEIPIITTEKDAVKLKDFGYTNIYALKLKTVIDVEDLLKDER